MLVSLNLENGTVDQKTRFFNFLSALHTVATAAAGSTPVVNPVSTNGVRDTNVNMIDVIDNTEAGGWNTGVSNNITDSTIYSSSTSTPWRVDLYNSTGKSTYPYYRLHYGNFTYAYNSSFNTYPGLQWIQGHTNNDPSVTAFGSDTNWFSSTNSTNWSIRSMDSGLTSSASNYMLRVDVANLTTYIASTAKYLIIWNIRGIVYWGVRDVAGWEINSTDNPPWCGFFYTNEGMTSSGFINGGVYHSNYQAAWMAAINRSGVIQSPQKFGQYNNYTNSSGSSLTGINNGSGTQYLHQGPYRPYGTQYVAYKNLNRLFEALRSEWGSGTSYASASYVSPCDSPITDPATGLTVPPAYPIIFKGNDNQQLAFCRGQAPGIYQGMITDSTGRATYVTANEYTIGGDQYIPALTGLTAQPDLFFIKKA